MTDFETDFTMTVGGRAIAGDASFLVLNPASENELARVPDCSQAELDEAVAAARAAFPGWATKPYGDRQRLVASIGAILSAHVDPLKRLLTREQGKPHDDAAGELMGAAYWCENMSRLDLPVTVFEDTPTRRGETRHSPIGVVGAIAPWNYPVLLAFFKIVPALLAGNTVVLKPSPFTPLTTLKIGELLRTVLPAGVLNVLSGGDRLGPWMTGHVGIDKISFTGSTATGRKVMASAATNLKRVTLELGGNDPAIVSPDIDITAVAKQLFWAAFRNTGQICIATKRIYVHKDVYEQLKVAIVDYARTIKMGDGAEQGVELGPIQNAYQYRRVLELIENSRAEGYRFLTGGEVPGGPGYFVPVTIIDNPPEMSRIVQEEQFGPILPLLRVESIDEAIERANASDYALGASVWSADLEQAQAIADRLEAGTVWINESQYLSPLGQFGGHKQSGLGVEGGLEGLLAYTNPRTTFITKAPGPGGMTVGTDEAALQAAL